MSSLRSPVTSLNSPPREGAQAPAAPQTPQAPQAPQAPGAPAPPPPTEDQVRVQVREAVRKSIEDARKAARDAKVAAQQVRHPDLPVVVDVGGSLQPPFDQESAQRAALTGAQYFLTSLTIIVLGVGILRYFSRRLAPAPMAPALSPQVAEQLLRIEHAVESVAIEVERISESQRFLTKLQAGKGEPAILPPRQGT